MKVQSSRSHNKQLTDTSRKSPDSSSDNMLEINDISYYKLSAEKIKLIVHTGIGEYPVTFRLLAEW
jgi:hypothetical protein